MLGDSITAQGEPYWSKLSANIVNLGESGDTIPKVTARLVKIAQVPRCLFLLIGINDLLNNATPDEIAKQYATLLDAIRARSRTPVIVQSIFPVSTKNRWGQKNSAIESANARIAAVATTHNAQYLNLSAALQGPDGALQPAYTSDGIHLSEDGYRRWIEQIEPQLNRCQG